MKTLEALLVAVVAMLVACGADPGPQGVWVMDPSLKPRLSRELEKEGLRGEALRQMVDSVMKGEIALQADGSFEMRTERFGRTRLARGKWAIQGGTVAVEIREADGVALPAPDTRTLRYQDGVLRWKGEDTPFEFVFLRQ